MFEFLKTWIITACVVVFGLVVFTSDSFAAVCVESAGPTSTGGPLKGAWYFWPISLPIEQCVDIPGACLGSAGSFIGADGICHRQMLFFSADFAQFQSIQIDVATLKGSADLVYDPLLAASFWSVAFFFTLGCWLLAKNYGLILQAIKRW